MARILRCLLGLHRRSLLAGGVLFAGVGGTAASLAEADSNKQPDGPMGGIVAGGQGILRSTRAITTFAANSFDYKYTLLKTTIKGEGEQKNSEYNKIKSEIHLRAAQRLLKLCESNRGIYIKAGQFMASLQHLPKEYTTTLAVLQDQARGRPFKLIEKVLLEEFGVNPNEIFAEFEEVPIAAASLAQVHRAKLRDGREVAVKVQYPGLEKQVETDLKTMAVLSKAVSWLFPDYKFEWIVPHFEENLAQQLDFQREGANSERTTKNFVNKKVLQVPKIFWGFTTRRVLTMEFMHGCKIDDVEGINAQGLDPKQVAEVLLEVFAEMIFCHGFVHGDPHPGNILVKACPTNHARHNFQVVLLDHGLYRELDEDFRKDFCRLWRALILADREGVKSLGEKLGAAQFSRFLPILFTGRPANSKAAFGEKMTPGELQELRKEVKQFSMGDVTSVIGGLSNDLFLVMKTDNLVRQIVTRLGAVPGQRLLINAKFAVTGLALKQRGETDFWKQGLVTTMRANMGCLSLLVRLEVWKVMYRLRLGWDSLSKTLGRTFSALFWCFFPNDRSQSEPGRLALAGL